MSLTRVGTHYRLDSNIFLLTIVTKMLMYTEIQRVLCKMHAQNYECYMKQKNR